MNIHRELAILRVLILRANEAMLRLREAQDASRERGQGPSWGAEVETLVYMALSGLERGKAKEIADAFEDKPVMKVVTP